MLAFVFHLLNLERGMLFEVHRKNKSPKFFFFEQKEIVPDLYHSCRQWCTVFNLELLHKFQAQGSKLGLHIY